MVPDLRSQYPMPSRDSPNMSTTSCTLLGRRPVLAHVLRGDRCGYPSGTICIEKRGTRLGAGWRPASSSFRSSTGSTSHSTRLEAP